MSEEKNLVTDPHHVLPVFVNEVVGRGCLNGVVNLTLAVAQFTPTESGISLDRTIAARLRMDLGCARQLHAELAALLAAVDAAAPTPEHQPALPLGERAH